MVVGIISSGNINISINPEVSHEKAFHNRLKYMADLSPIGDVVIEKGKRQIKWVCQVYKSVEYIRSHSLHHTTIIIHCRNYLPYYLSMLLLVVV